MIIFDLDGTLADCEHRRHYVDPLKTGYINDILQKWEPNWKAFYEDCDKDVPFIPVIQIFTAIETANICPITKKIMSPVHIWSGRCESVRGKTEWWINHHVTPFLWDSFRLKMRPIGDSTPDDILKERWLDESLSQGKKIDFVFDDRPKVVCMWRRRGIFVFDVNQSGEEF